jgi:TetR/AcrR family transcriptional repressor of nem operon
VLSVDANVSGMIGYRPTGQMKHCPDPKKTLVQTALKLFATHGYYHTSIADILRESGCKRGTLYYHFSSKEELGYAVIDEWVRLVTEQGAASHLRSSEHPIDRLIKVVDDMPAGLKLETSGSITIAIGARMATVHEGFRKRLIARLAQMVDGIEQMLRKGIADGQIADNVDPRQMAHIAMIVAHGIQMASLLGQHEVISPEARRWIRDRLNSLRG